jgi:hypothetical protein
MILIYYKILFHFLSFIIMNTPFVLSSIAIGLTIINTFLVVNTSIINKNVNNITLELIIMSLLITIVWSIYGYIENHMHILIGNIIIIILLLFLLYYKYI